MALLLRSGACSDPCWKRQSAGSTCQCCQNTSVKCEIAVCVIIFFLLSLIYSVPVLCAWFGIRSHHFSMLFEGWNKALWCHLKRKVFINLFGGRVYRKREKQRDRDIFHPLLHSPKSQRPGLGQIKAMAQEPGASFRAATWVAGIQVSGPSSAAFHML